MLVPKRFLPSLSMLAIFEAAARHGSFSAAAEELCLSQSAISRQIKSLEERLEHELFIRDRKTVRVTEAGEQYAQAVREALLLIAKASMNLRASPESGTLNISVPQSFGANWLVPKLPMFFADNSDIKINLVTQDEMVDFHMENLDAGIYFGTGDWSKTKSSFLIKEKLVPVCSASFYEQHQINSPDSILGAPQIHLSTRPDAWERWLLAQGVDFDFVTGLLFDNFDTALQAARESMGIVLVPDYMFCNGIMDDRLVRPFDSTLESEEGYYLVWPEDSEKIAILERFYNWLWSES